MLRLWILFTLGSVAMGAGPLEEVLEHGPLFDELEDEAWWSGVDLVDTATHLFEIEAQDYCGTGEEDCSSSVPLHQDHLRLPPPPPVPPALSELVKQLHLLAPSSESSTTTGCLLCQWASLNGTSMDDLIPNPELSSENTWVPMLVVVALVSAMLGAVLMITALKCRRLKVLPRGGSCTTLPVGYMVGEGKEGVVHQNSELMLETLPKSSESSSSYTPSGSSVGSNHEMSRPRLCTPTIPNNMDHHRHMKIGAASSQATGWRVKLWRKMTGKSQMTSAMDQSDAISAVYAELNSVSGGGSSTSGPSSIYHLNTYSEIREPCRRMMIHPQHLSRARILNSDGTYENGAYGDRVLHLLEVDALSSNCSASTPSSAYYSDLSDRSGQQQWVAMRQRLGSEGHHSSHSLPPPQCCGHHHIHHVPAALHCGSRTLIHHHHHARDLMPVTLQVIPDNQQYPAVSHSNGSSCTMDPSSQHFLRGGVSASLNGGSTKRPLPPLPSRQQQRPQRRYAYSGGVMDGGEPQDDLSCVPVPSEYV